MLVLSDKQTSSFCECDTRYNIWIGAVRSGKTFISMRAFIDFMRNGPAGDVMIIGVSRETVQRNVVNLLYSMLDLKPIGPKTTETKIFSRNVYFVGAGNEGAMRRIQGATLAIAYVDEITCLPQSFWSMLQSRLSVPGARLFGTCNPEGPSHWFKKNFIDKASELKLKYWNFGLEDNPSLDADFKESLKKEYSGMWYKRYILGEWAVATGMIYDCFDDSNIYTEETMNPNYYIAGIDYGTVNATCCLLAAITPNEFPQIRIQKEYYYDSVKMGRAKTDAELADDIEKFLALYSLKALYIDPAAASLKIELRNRNLPVVDANNDVLSGIQVTAKFVQGKNLQINESCTNLIDQMYSYHWDPKAADRGVDKPNKVEDHCFTANTMITTSCGSLPIYYLKPGDRVLTRNGFRKIVQTFHHLDATIVINILGKKVECTPNHPFLTLKGWKESSQLIDSDIFFINLEEDIWLKQSDSMGLNIEDTKNRPIKVIENITELEKEIALKDMDISIATFGNSITEKFHQDTIFITLTSIPKTMTLAISNLSQCLNTFPFMGEILVKAKEKLSVASLKRSALLQKFGTGVKRGKNGIQFTGKNVGKKESPSSSTVSNAEKDIQPLSQQEVDFVRITVNLCGEEKLVLMMSKESVNAVEIALESINIVKPSIAQSLVVEKRVEKREVYNLEVEEFNEFYAEDVLVHNCNDSLRYLIFSHFPDGDLDRSGEMTHDQLMRHVFDRPNYMMDGGLGGYY